MIKGKEKRRNIFWEKKFLSRSKVCRLRFSRQTFIGGEMENLLMEEEKREAWEGNSKCCFQIQEWDRKSTQDLILTWLENNQEKECKPQNNYRFVTDWPFIQPKYIQQVSKHGGAKENKFVCISQFWKIEISSVGATKGEFIWDEIEIWNICKFKTRRCK